MEKPQKKVGLEKTTKNKVGLEKTYKKEKPTKKKNLQKKKVVWKITYKRLSWFGKNQQMVKLVWEKPTNGKAGLGKIYKW